MIRSSFFMGMAAAALASIAGNASAQTARDVNYFRFHDVQIQVTAAEVTFVSSGAAVGNVAIVPPGATITVEANYIMFFSENPASYKFCSGCFIQNYLAWYPNAVTEGASPANVGFWNGQSTAPGSVFTNEGATTGRLIFTTTVPSTPGEYYIGVGETLDFVFQPGTTGGPGYDLSVPVVGGQQFASFLINVTRTPTSTCDGDADGNGVVNFSDIARTLAAFGTFCP